MLNFSPEKLFLVGVIALIVLGPNRLPQAARSLGRLVATLRHMSSGFQEEVRSALAEPSEMVNSAVSEFRPPDVRRSIREGVNSIFSPQAPPGTNQVPKATNGSGGSGPTNLPTGTPDDPNLN